MKKSILGIVTCKFLGPGDLLCMTKIAAIVLCFLGSLGMWFICNLTAPNKYTLEDCLLGYNAL